MKLAIARVFSSAAAALAGLVIGCGPPPVVQAPTSPVATAPVLLGSPPAETPPAAPGPSLATEDDRVRVPRPRGDAWDCHAERVESAQAGVNASFVQCLRRTPAGTISLMAKDYQVSPKDVMSAEALSTIEYPKHYKKRWDHVTYTRSGAVDHHGNPAYEVTIELSRDDGAAVHLVERVLVVGTHTLNLSADAPPGVFAVFEAEVTRWFNGTEFAALRADPTWQAALWRRDILDAPAVGLLDQALSGAGVR
jgi:hypothetical protein